MRERTGSRRRGESRSQQRDHKTKAPHDKIGEHQIGCSVIHSIIMVPVVYVSNRAARVNPPSMILSASFTNMLVGLRTEA